MQIQVNSDSHVHASAAFIDEIKSEMESCFHRFANQITRLEVHLGDQNSHKSGERDKRCLIEARLAGLDPVAASEQADTLEAAIDGAVRKVEKILDRMVDRLEHKKGRTSFAGDQDM